VTGGVLRLAHLSDLHVLDLAGVRVRDFLNKRVTGGATLLVSRRRAHSVAAVEAALADLATRDVDHVVVTGDLTNLSLPSEFDRVAALLRPLGGPERVSVVPGNHDCYTGESVGRFEELFDAWLTSDLPRPEGATYPYVKLLGDVALVGLSTARPTPWLLAAGALGPGQLGRLTTLLASEELASRFVVVALHHPLRNERGDWLYVLRCLWDAPGLRRLLAARGVGLVLHGHDHLVQRAGLPRKAGEELPLHAVSSTSFVGGGDPRRLARYVVYAIDAAEGKWEVAEERVWDGGRGEFVAG